MSIYTNVKDDKVYALYKGDELLADGTIDEIAEKMNVTRKSIEFYKRPVWKRRTNENKARRLILLDDDDDE